VSDQHPPDGPPPPPGSPGPSPAGDRPGPDGPPPPAPSQGYPPPQAPYPPPSAGPPPAAGPTAAGGQGWRQQGWAPPIAGGPSGEPERGRVLPLRPLTVGDVLDGAFRLLRDRFGRVALLVVLVFGPYQLASSYAFDRFIPELGAAAGADAFTFGAEFSDELAARMFAVSSLAGLLGMLVYLVVGAALVWMVLREDEGRPAEIGPALRGGLRRLWATGAGTFLVGLGAMGVLLVVMLLSFLLGAVFLPLGFLVGLPAGLVLMLAWLAATSLVIPVAMTESGAGAVGSAGRALSLLRRRFWPIVGVTALVLLMLALVSFAISLAFGLLAMLAGPAAWVVDGVSGTLVSVVTTPATVFAALLIYLDARVRLEGLDLALRARRPQQQW
jgi:hypothetical protein